MSRALDKLYQLIEVCEDKYQTAIKIEENTLAYKGYRTVKVSCQDTNVISNLSIMMVTWQIANLRAGDEYIYVDFYDEE